MAMIKNGNHKNEINTFFILTNLKQRGQLGQDDKAFCSLTSQLLGVVHFFIFQIGSKLIVWVHDPLPLMGGALHGTVQIGCQHLY